MEYWNLDTISSILAKAVGSSSDRKFGMALICCSGQWDHMNYGGKQ